MQNKNAKQLVKDVCTQLESAKGTLDQAIQSAEKQENKQSITNTLSAVDSALSTANGTLSTYKD